PHFTGFFRALNIASEPRLRQNQKIMFQSVVEAYLKRIIALTLVFMVVGTLARAFFLALYTPPGLSEFSSDVLKAFILGARFDLTVQAYIYSIPLLLLLLISGVDLIFPLITEST